MATQGGITVYTAGAREFSELSRDLKRLGAVNLRRELYRGLGKAGKPVIEDVRKNARETLPARGGLAERVATSNIRVFSRGSVRGHTARIQFRAQERAGRSIDVYALNVGKLRHPLFGNRRHWYQERVKPGWFTDPIQNDIEKFRESLEEAIQRVEEEFNRG